jgi:GT2 family glycosyltransferase
MINGEKIGVGIITCNRPELFNKLLKSLVSHTNIFDYLVICEDTLIDNPNHNNYICSISQQILNDFENKIIVTNNKNIGVGVSKNICLHHLSQNNCDHIFLIEDDIFIKDIRVFEKYIEASKISGIQHFNYSQHGMMNKTFDHRREPNPRLTINYDDILNISFYQHCVGAFSYYSHKCIDCVGFIDENYFNACEHVDHTFQIIKSGMHSPFWYFADISNSWDYLGDEEWSREKSTISCSPNHDRLIKDADTIFKSKHGCLPMQIPDENIENFGIAIKQIRKKYGSYNIDM